MYYLLLYQLKSTSINGKGRIKEIIAIYFSIYVRNQISILIKLLSLKALTRRPCKKTYVAARLYVKFACVYWIYSWNFFWKNIFPSSRKNNFNIALAAAWCISQQLLIWNRRSWVGIPALVDLWCYKFINLYAVVFKAKYAALMRSPKENKWRSWFTPRKCKNTKKLQTSILIFNCQTFCSRLGTCASQRPRCLRWCGPQIRIRLLSGNQTRSGKWPERRQWKKHLDVKCQSRHSWRRKEVWPHEFVIESSKM
jgi:hypothetical protein